MKICNLGKEHRSIGVIEIYEKSCTKKCCADFSNSK
jgi:hypothetical protein